MAHGKYLRVIPETVPSQRASREIFKTDHLFILRRQSYFSGVARFSPSPDRQIKFHQLRNAKKPMESLWSFNCLRVVKYSGFQGYEADLN